MKAAKDFLDKIISEAESQSQLSEVKENEGNTSVGSNTCTRSILNSNVFGNSII